jgi:hypothetical protein
VKARFEGNRQRQEPPTAPPARTIKLTKTACAAATNADALKAALEPPVIDRAIGLTFPLKKSTNPSPP